MRRVTKVRRETPRRGTQIGKPRFQTTSIDSAPFEFDDRNVAYSDDRPWFVYLFPLQDCSAFKVGFSCNPLRRISSFSGRYFERFDLCEATLLQLNSSDDARAVEAMLKSELAEVRMQAPDWVPLEAGGHTEWFSAIDRERALARMLSFVRTYEGAVTITVTEFFRGALVRLLSSFEPWAFDQAQRLCADAHSVSLGYEPTIAPRSLRDWLDAYRHFDVALFADDPAVRAFVTASARVG